MDIQVSPRREDTVSVSDAVVAAHRVIESSNLQYMLHPMGTCIEGEPTQLYSLAADIHLALIKLGYPRISIAIKVDDRYDKPQSMMDKLNSVKEKMR